MACIHSMMSDISFTITEYTFILQQLVALIQGNKKNTPLNNTTDFWFQNAV